MKNVPFSPLLILFLLSLLAACIAAPKPIPDKLVLKHSTFASLAGWQEDNFTEVLPVFLKSCEKLTALPEKTPLLPSGIGGNAGDWFDVCNEARNINGQDNVAIREFFEHWFVPFSVLNNDQNEGLFTGYYEIDLYGSRTKTARYNEPLYKSVGHTPGKPFYSRQEINNGALTKKNLELLYVDDPVEAFFLHIQGSGRVWLEDGTVVRVGYAEQNGHPYVAIGRCLIEQGAIDREHISARAIKDWLYTHKDQARRLMEKNPSYIFFREIKGEGPIGSQSVALSAERSLAVDKRFLPLGVPLWLNTSYPETPTLKQADFHKLMIAQDTGGAIKGPVRGDIFFGNGKKAEMLAEYMKSKGSYTLLLPLAAANKVKPSFTPR